MCICGSVSVSVLDGSGLPCVQVCFNTWTFGKELPVHCSIKNKLESSTGFWALQMKGKEEKNEEQHDILSVSWRRKGPV